MSRPPRPRLVVSEGKPTAQARPRNLFALAYERLEDLIVRGELQPGQALTMVELQALTGLGRTPVHQAVNRLASDTLILVRPRHGLQIAPIDLARERTLLALRRDLERFVIRLAAERAGPSHRNHMLHLARTLRARRAALSIDAFNRLDRKQDALILAAAGEPFLEHTLGPLHTIFRRIGRLYHAHLEQNLNASVDGHLAILEAVATRQTEAAVRASDDLLAFIDTMFDVLEREVDPTLLDCSVEPYGAL